MKAKPLVGLIDTGTSNIKSVYYALQESNVDILHIQKYKDIDKKIKAIVVPGIGSFGYVMQKIKEDNLDQFIIESIKFGTQSLFICVGMQILFSKSKEFGLFNGLDLFKGDVERLNKNNEKNTQIKVPFIGWNKLKKKKDSKILRNISNDEFFYFTHSYYVKPKNESIISSFTEYSGFDYCSSISDKNIHAVQFHPEKSGKSGLKIYKNFVEMI